MPKIRACLLFLLAVPAFAAGLRAQASNLVPNGYSTSCDFKDIQDALRRLREAGPQIASLLDCVANGPTLYVITRSSSAQPSAHEAPWGGEIYFDPEPGGKRYSDGVCIDPLAALVHELQHACDRQRNTIDRTALLTTNQIPRSEIAAVTMENLYRDEAHLCRRTTYERKPLPGADAISNCGNEKVDMPCPDYRSSCSLQTNYCCWIYGGIKLPNGAWGACTIDNMDPDVCHSLTGPGASAGAYDSPCNFPGTEACP